jgi:hypothetical protein
MQIWNKILQNINFYLEFLFKIKILPHIYEKQIFINGDLYWK